MQVSWGENVKMALGAVWLHRFRSLLTVLGIVIGITTVVTVSSLLTGLRQGVVQFFEEFGPDNIFLYKTSGDPNAMFTPPKEAKRKAIRPEYAEMIKSDIGDIKNTGGRWGGAITAAEFLKVFVEDTPWIHLDIAGMAWMEDSKPYIAKGPSGVGVRSILEWVRKYSP